MSGHNSKRQRNDAAAISGSGQDMGDNSQFGHRIATGSDLSTPIRQWHDKMHKRAQYYLEHRALTDPALRRPDLRAILNRKRKNSKPVQEMYDCLPLAHATNVKILLDRLRNSYNPKSYHRPDDATEVLGCMADQTRVAQIVAQNETTVHILVI